MDHRARAPQPFADFTLRQVRRTLADRANGQDELAVSAALTALLSRAGDGSRGDDSPTRKTARRVAAKTRAAAPAAATNKRLRPLDDGDDDERSQPRSSDPVNQASSPPAAVVPFGLFDARAEARRIW